MLTSTSPQQPEALPEALAEALPEVPPKALPEALPDVPPGPRRSHPSADRWVGCGLGRPARRRIRGATRIHEPPKTHPTQPTQPAEAAEAADRGAR